MQSNVRIYGRENISEDFINRIEYFLLKSRFLGQDPDSLEETVSLLFEFLVGQAKADSEQIVRLEKEINDLQLRQLSYCVTGGAAEKDHGILDTLFGRKDFDEQQISLQRRIGGLYKDVNAYKARLAWLNTLKDLNKPFIPESGDFEVFCQIIEDYDLREVAAEANPRFSSSQSRPWYHFTGARKSRIEEVLQPITVDTLLPFNTIKNELEAYYETLRSGIEHFFDREIEIESHLANRFCGDVKTKVDAKSEDRHRAINKLFKQHAEENYNAILKRIDRALQADYIGLALKVVERYYTPAARQELDIHIHNLIASHSIA